MKQQLLRLIAAHVCLHVCMAGTRMAAPLLALREGHSPVAVGVLLALFALAQVFLALPAGRYADRHGLRRPVGWAVLVAMLGAGAAAAWPTFGVLCFAALLTGGATGAASIAVQRQAGVLATNPTELKQVFSWLAIGPALSNFAGPFGAGLLIDHGGFRLAFAVLALVPLLSWWWVRSQQAPARAAPSATAAAGPGAWDLMREPPFRRLMIVNWLLASCWDVHTFLVPVLGHERGMSASAIGAVLGGFALAATAVRVLMPLLAAHLREAVVVSGAMVATALLFGVYPLAHSALAMGGLSVLLGVALGSVQPMIMSTLHQITPSHRHGEALGLRLMAINGSSVLMPLLFGSAGVVVGTAGVFWVAGAAVGLGARLPLRR
ncbi:MFS transporter [Hydrogenophaga defluvii]|uniref:MFS transporter n=1 Tax=Hydrogenophaga defluvii TaxID=249410 RepID=A0ABW2S8V7_9BURK